MDPKPLIDLMQSRFEQVHQALPSIRYTELRGQSCGGRVCAALGYRRAHIEPLFLEAYLNEPVETLLSNQFERCVTRNDIVEIGNLASCNAPAMIALWAQTANDLGGQAEIAVAVLTLPLRRMFARLGVPLVEIVRADPASLGDASAEWGAYYAQDPVVCAGVIADGQAQLARFLVRIERQAA
jgi:hypothetical protein